MTILFDFNRTLFDPETGSLFPGVLSMLHKLAKRYTLLMVTRNEGQRQNSIKALGIDSLFADISLVAEKSEASFQKITTGYTNIIVVGDRLQDEIKIGNTLGWITVHVKQGIFAEQHAQDIKANHTIQKIDELEKILQQYG